MLHITKSILDREQEETRDPFGKKIGKKKLAKMQAKAEAKAEREQVDLIVFIQLPWARCNCSPLLPLQWPFCFV